MCSKLFMLHSCLFKEGDFVGDEKENCDVRWGKFLCKGGDLKDDETEICDMRRERNDTSSSSSSSSLFWNDLKV